MVPHLDLSVGETVDFVQMQLSAANLSGNDASASSTEIDGQISVVHDRIMVLVGYKNNPEDVSVLFPFWRILRFVQSGIIWSSFPVRRYPGLQFPVV